MNIQELQWVYNEKLPVKIIVLNNHALGMIRFLQKDYFDNRFEGTSGSCGYAPCNFAKVAQAYGIESAFVSDISEINDVKEMLQNDNPFLLEISLSEDSNAFPKTYLGEKIYNQRPYMPESMLAELKRK